MKLRTLLANVAAATLMATGAYAADMTPMDITPEPPEPTGYWTGFYVGGQLGWAEGKADRDWGDYLGQCINNSGDVTGYLGEYIGWDYDNSTSIYEWTEYSYTDGQDVSSEVNPNSWNGETFANYGTTHEGNTYLKDCTNVYLNALAAPSYEEGNSEVGMLPDWSHTNQMNQDGHSDQSFSDTGFIKGAHAGYDHQFDSNLVLGLGGQINWVDLSGSAENEEYGSPIVHTWAMDWIASITPRIGFAVQPDLLLYAKGGLAWAKIEDTATETYDSGSVVGTSVTGNETVQGWTAGVGAEYLINANWSIGVAYDYYKFDYTTDYYEDNEVGNGGWIQTETFDTEVEVHTVTARASYRF